MPLLDTVLWIVFLSASLFLAFISRRSLPNPHSHGFYRFFAWEILVAMFLLNVQGWFVNPLSWHQLVSWLLLIASLALVIQGVRLLRDIGRQNASRSDQALLGLEKTSRLVTTGLYRFIRHPMYSSPLFLGWGMFFKSPSWLDAGLAVVCTFFLVATARVEELENIAYFGDEYVEYMKCTKMFIPDLL